MKLSDLMTQYTRTKFATDSGAATHAKMQHVVIGPDQCAGNADLIAHLRQMPEIIDLFAPDARTEVPVAGTISGKFISRRIDRLRVDVAAKTVHFIDYKTDTNPDARRDSYLIQMREYAQLLKKIYPGYQISGHLLWMHNWTLEPIRID